MAHYYAYCERHGKCGPDRNDSDPNARELAWGDVTTHKTDVSGPHGEVYVKHSLTLVSKKGNRYYKYSAFRIQD